MQWIESWRFQKKNKSLASSTSEIANHLALNSENLNDELNKFTI